MIVVFFFFSLLLLATPPLILGVWVVLLVRFGVLELLFRPTKTREHSKGKVAVNKVGPILPVGVFGVLILLYLCLIFVWGQKVKELETNILGERSYSIVLTFLVSPVFLILISEAWLSFLSYFGLHYLLHHLKIPLSLSHLIKSFVMTIVQSMSILTGLIGFGWWSNLGITNENRFEHIFNISMCSVYSVVEM